MAINYADLRIKFKYRGPEKDPAGRYEKIQKRVLTLARYIVAHTPESHEQSLALMHLQQAMFYANAAIAQKGEENGDQ